jgi:hypothetical protein
MINLYVTYGPWLLSSLTVMLTIMQGNKYRHAWSLTLINQVLWLAWILLSGTYGFILLNICMWIVCIRNHLKWSKELKYDT